MRSGDLIEAEITPKTFRATLVRKSSSTQEIAGQTPLGAILSPNPTYFPVTRCTLAVAPASDRAALVIPLASGTAIELLNLAAGQLAGSVQVGPHFPIHFPDHALGYLAETGQLALSEAHFRASGEPEIATDLFNQDGTVVPPTHLATGGQYTEVWLPSFDFSRDRVWFLCPVYSARSDRQPRCTLTSASLLGGLEKGLEIPPPPDDRVAGSGQPALGFPTPGVAMLLAEHRLWLYDFNQRTFRQLNLPETPHHIRWFEFPNPAKFTSDGHFAAVPVSMFHYPLFEEGQVSHGTKIIIVDLRTLRILETIQPPHEARLIDFALEESGSNLTLTANWGKDWQTRSMSVSVSVSGPARAH